jgi:hypothetical protein
VTKLRALVVYESHWGNTATIAQAIAEGIGPGARAVSTAQAGPAQAAEVDLLVAGAPLLGFSLPTAGMLKGLAQNAARDPVPPKLDHPSMREWLDTLPAGTARAAAFETRIWWSPGSAAKTVLRQLEARGYRPAAGPERFIVKGKYGPLRDGEVERARAWGAALATSLVA